MLRGQDQDRARTGGQDQDRAIPDISCGDIGFEEKKAPVAW